MKFPPQLASLFLCGLFAAGTLAQNPATVPTPRNPLTATAWISRHEGILEEAKRGGIELLFLGDSITDNWRKKGLPVWEKYYAPRQAANFGIGGDRNKPVDKPTQMETIRQVNERIVKLDDGKTIRFLNINHNFLGPDGKVHEEVMPKFLHLSEEGYQIWAAAMEPTLARMLKGTIRKRG